MPGLFGSPTVPYKFQVFDVNNVSQSAFTYNVNTLKSDKEVIQELYNSGKLTNTNYFIFQTEHEASGTLQFAAYGLDKEDPVFLIPLAVKDQG
ncbi:hypothetical protein EDC05_000765 [Coemansia umbellata]|uniref:Uncharacterized protein n=1 Tax=Coemansia umbellata TaxID=1424467 RepID=A0ABQ8PTI9_9FUNG|nr:hypothetical protein EDC05_000765 [Coemansia umbellata]